LFKRYRNQETILYSTDRRVYELFDVKGSFWTVNSFNFVNPEGGGSVRTSGNFWPTASTGHSRYSSLDFMERSCQFV